MKLPWTWEEWERELDRIDADEFLRSGLATTGGITAEEVWLAIRTTPTGAGSSGFEATLLAIVDARKARESAPDRGDS